MVSGSTDYTTVRRRGVPGMSGEVDPKALVTPATTPGSTNDDESSLVPKPPKPRRTRKKKPWYHRYPPPYAIITASVFELVVFFVTTTDVSRLLRYDPNNQIEAWRFVTYMLLHDNFFHIILNVVIQCLFAFTLEKNQGNLRVGILYFGGGATGALGASCIRPDLVVGASAGVYALLISHLSHIILNFDSTKYKIYSCLTVVIIALSDVTYNLIHARHKGEPVISEGAHVAGAVSGFFLGLLLYKSKDKGALARNRVAFWVAFVVFVVLIATLLILNFQIKRCTPADSIKIRYSYIC